MKQRITPQQYDELNKDSRDKLAKWVISKGGKTSYDHVLSIGQMIEFLVEHDIDWINELYWITGKDGLAPQFVKGFGDKELCDALWELIKGALEK